jgi:hypothetical protein
VRRRAWNLCGVVLVNWVIALAQAPSSRAVHVIEVLADKDSRYNRGTGTDRYTDSRCSEPRIGPKYRAGTCC